MNWKNMYLFLVISSFLLVESCGSQESVTRLKNGDLNQGRYLVQVHNVGHIDFPGILGRQIFENDVVQLLLATAFDRTEGTCQIIQPNLLDSSLKVNTDLIERKNTEQWSYVGWKPIIAFWRVQSDKKLDYFRESISEVFDGLTIRKDFMVPQPKRFGLLTKTHRGNVKLTFPEPYDPKKLGVKLKASGGIALDFLIEPTVNEGACVVKMEYWCSPASSPLCKTANSYEARERFDPVKGLGIISGFLSNGLGRSSIAKALSVEEYTTLPIEFSTDSIVPYKRQVLNNPAFE